MQLTKSLVQRDLNIAFRTFGLALCNSLMNEALRFSVCDMATGEKMT